MIPQLLQRLISYLIMQVKLKDFEKKTGQWFLANLLKLNVAQSLIFTNRDLNEIENPKTVRYLGVHK